MKKQEIIHVLLKALIGFPIGITLLMIAYGSMYIIGGQDLFTTELYQLSNIETFIKQLIINGISTYILIISMTILLGDVIKNKGYKSVILRILFSLITIILAMYILKNDIFSINIIYMNITSFVVASVFVMIYIVIRDKINMHLINQKIKEINKQ